MAKMNYFDFDLLIERIGENYKAQVVSSPGGQGKLEFQLPFSPLEIENFLLRIGRPRRNVRRVEAPELEAIKTFGGRLFDTVFDDEVRDCLRNSLNEAEHQGMGLRIRLRLNNTPELADLPWEYLYNKSFNRFLALAKETPLVRYLDLAQRIRPLPVKPPLKVLGMISGPYNFPELDIEREWRLLNEVLQDLEQQGLVILERLEKATLSALQRRLRQDDYHIFHYVGHGGFDRQSQDGVLILEDDEGRGREVSGQYLGMLLRNNNQLRLAILNACEGARTSQSDPFSGTAQSLVQQGIPAVIAMQFEITDDAAITFAREFYAAVVDGDPIDAALVEARTAIFADGNNVEWGTPVLYMRASDGRIFDIKRLTDEERRAAKLAYLFRTAEAAKAHEDWPIALARLQDVLALEPENSLAKLGIQQVKQEQAVATLYAQAKKQYEAQDWSRASESLHKVRDQKPQYKDVDDLIASIEKMREEQEHREKIAILLSEAKQAEAREQWSKAVQKYQAVLQLDPYHAAAKNDLRRTHQEQKLAELYALAQEHSQAKRWSQALAVLSQVQEQRPHYKDVDDLIVAWRKLSREQEQHDKIAKLLREAREAEKREDWRAAMVSYQAVLAQQPAHAEATKGQQHAQQEQELAENYAEGLEYSKAKRWDTALKCLYRAREINPRYRQVNDLITAAERARDEESRHDKVTLFFREAQDAVAREQWQPAAEKYQAILALDPANLKAKAGLKLAQQEKQLADLYAQGLEHYEARRWLQTLECFQKLRELRPNYLNVEALIAATKVNLGKKGGRRSRAPIYVAIAATLVLVTVLIFKLISTSSAKTTLTLSTQPEGATVLANGQEIGKTPLDKQTVAEEKITLSLRKVDYFPLDTTVVIQPQQATKLTFVLRPAAMVAIKVNPADAEVTVDGETVATAQLAQLMLAVGTHAIKISRSEYETQEAEMNLKQGANPPLQYALTPSTTAPTVGGVKITSVPSSAFLSLNGRNVGRTPYSNEALPPGTHRLRVSLEGYQNESRDITVRSGETTPVEVVLTKTALGKLSVSVQPSASIYIDGQLRQTNAQGQRSFDLSPGRHQLRVENPSLGKWEKSVEIQANQTQNVSIDFNKTVRLTVTAFDTDNRPVRATIWVDNKDTGLTTPRQFDLNIGQHRIAVQREGYELVGAEQVLTLEADLANPIRFTLKKIQ